MRDFNKNSKSRKKPNRTQIVDDSPIVSVPLISGIDTMKLNLPEDFEMTSLFTTGNEFPVHHDFQTLGTEIQFPILTESGEIRYGNLPQTQQEISTSLLSDKDVYSNLDSIMYPTLGLYSPIEITDSGLLLNCDSQSSNLDYPSLTEEANPNLSQFNLLSTQIDIPIMQEQITIVNGIIQPLTTSISEYSTPLLSQQYPSMYNPPTIESEISTQLKPLELLINEYGQDLSEIRSTVSDLVHAVDSILILKVSTAIKRLNHLNDKTLAMEKLLILLVCEIAKRDKSFATRLLEEFATNLAAQAILSILLQA